MIHVRSTLVFFITFLAAGALMHASLDDVRAESNLEKRSGLALDNAAAALKDARTAYNAGDMGAFKAKLAEVDESVDLASKSLEQTKKDPRRSPKWFKRAEISSRDLLRGIDSLKQEMSYTDRPEVQRTETHIQQIHDQWLSALIEGKSK